MCYTSTILVGFFLQEPLWMLRPLAATVILRNAQPVTIQFHHALLMVM